MKSIFIGYSFPRLDTGSIQVLIVPLVMWIIRKLNLSFHNIKYPQYI